MGEEQLKILNMLKDGKITVEDAERLLGLCADDDAGYRSGGEFAEFTRELPDAVIRNMREAIKTVGEVGNTVGKKCKVIIAKGGEHVQKNYRKRPFKVLLPEGVTEAKVMISAKVGSAKIKGAHSQDNIIATGVRKAFTASGVEFIPDPDDASRCDLVLESEAGSLVGALHPGLVYDIEVDNSAGSVKLDLEDLRVRNILIENSMGAISIKLGSLVPDAALSISNNAGKVKLTMPADAGITVVTSGQMGTHNLDDFGLIRDGENFVSADFKEKTTKLSIDLEQTLGAFKLRRG